MSRIACAIHGKMSRLLGKSRARVSPNRRRDAGVTTLMAPDVGSTILALSPEFCVGDTATSVPSSLIPIGKKPYSPAILLRSLSPYALNFDTPIYSLLHTLFVAGVLLLVAGANCMYASNSAVIDLRPNNFDNLVLNSDHIWVVEFYAPWCGHCQQLTPEYDKAATALKVTFNLFFSL